MQINPPNLKTIHHYLTIKMEQNQLAFLKKYPAAIYRTALLATLQDEKLPTEKEKMFRGDLEYLLAHPNEGLIRKPEEFLKRWLNGRIEKSPDLGHYAQCKGFELQLPQVRIDRYDKDKSFGKIKGLVIASDFGYSNDFGDDIVFAINDIHSKRVLTYHDKNGEYTKRKPQGRRN
jgi:hypothetical protein